MDKSSRIFVAGHRGLAGSAICRCLLREGHLNLITRTHGDLDLCDARAVDAFFASERPEYVFLAAARVGGILANSTYPVDFLRDNLAIELNVIDSAWRHGVKKLQFLGSSCVYPKMAAQPIREEYLLSGPLEPTNEWYAIAKITGIKLAQAYRKQYGFSAICLMPTNLYGPGDNFDLQSSHFLPALIRKIHEAKTSGEPEVLLWGSGTPRRQLLHVDDLADAAVYLMCNYDEEEIINVGTGEDLTIAEVAGLVCKVLGYQGRVVWDRTKPDGTPRKLLDLTKLTNLSWQAKIALERGIFTTYEWFLKTWAKAPC